MLGLWMVAAAMVLGNSETGRIGAPPRLPDAKPPRSIDADRGGPPEPAEPEPSEPAEPEPSEPAEPEPSEPAELAPSEPAEPEPSEPAESTSSGPAEPTPSGPKELEPSGPAELGAPEPTGARSPGPARLDWRAPTGTCPTAATLRTSIVDLAGRWPAASELDVRAEAVSGPEGWRLELVTRVGDSTHAQSLEAPSCEAVAKALVLIVAVSIDPVSSATVVKLAIPRPPPDEPVPDPAAPDSPPPRKPRTRFFAGLSLGVASGMTPGVSGGPRLSLGLDFERGRVGVEGRYVAPRTVTASDGVGAGVQAGAAAVVGCFAARRRRIRPQVCVGLEAGALRGRGRGIGRAATQNFPWLAVTGGGGLRWQITDTVALAADLEAALAVFDALVVVGSVDSTDRRVVYANPRLGVRGLLGVEISWGRGKK